MNVWAWTKIVLADRPGLQHKTLAVDEKWLLYVRGEEYLKPERSACDRTALNLRLLLRPPTTPLRTKDTLYFSHNLCLELQVGRFLRADPIEE